MISCPASNRLSREDARIRLQGVTAWLTSRALVLSRTPRETPEREGVGVQAGAMPSCDVTNSFDDQHRPTASRPSGRVAAVPRGGRVWDSGLASEAEGHPRWACGTHH